MTAAERLAKATRRLEEAAELSGTGTRSVEYLHTAASVRTLSRDLGRGHTPSAQAVRVLANSVELLADRAPRDSREQLTVDSATLTLAALAQDLEEGL